MLQKFKAVGNTVAKRARTGAEQARIGATKASANVRARTAKQDDQYLVALDIGTEFVKALVGKVSEDGATVEIVGVGRAHQSLSDMQAGAISDIAGVVENCDKALHQAEEQAGVSVRTAIIGIAGELVKGTTTTVRVARKQATKPLDIAEMEKIINLVQERAQEKAKQQLAWELGGKEVDVRLVNSALVSIEIDGYPVTNPIGFQGKDVVVQLYTAFAPMIHIGALEKTAEELDLDLLAVAAEPFAVARAVIGNNPNQNLSAILMDVGGGTTDIAVINEGGVQGTKMFGIGGRAYTHAVERELSVEFEQAEELKLGLSTNKIPSQKRPAIEAALNKTAETWVSGIELALSEFTKLDHLPHRMFLCGGGSSLDILMERLEATEWYKSLPFTRKPSVHHIRPGQVPGMTDLTGDVTDHTFITAMGLLRVGMDTKQFSAGKSGSIREKIDKMLST
ncbi:MAG: Actin-like protein ATPase involved in cell division-like protein [Candidatus Saccharibacteria bacterium]|nr:Actin-like protein ATPase involved in cell division-like protein [Candidatus Saccharibacteria bacterium]